MLEISFIYDKFHFFAVMAETLENIPASETAKENAIKQVKRLESEKSASDTARQVAENINSIFDARTNIFRFISGCDLLNNEEKFYDLIVAAYNQCLNEENVQNSAVATSSSSGSSFVAGSNVAGSKSGQKEIHRNFRNHDRNLRDRPPASAVYKDFYKKK
jgi:metal-dependent amidase/aminoacylase/carboxypeptidase family protein